jgi:hypothetical protein
MNVLTDTWRGLLRRRLWPVALLLIAALAAVPKLLAKQPEPVPAPAVPAVVKGAAESGPAPTLVSATQDPQGGRRRYVLGARKDPFAPAPLPKVKKAKKKQATTAKKATPAATPAPSSSSGPSTPPVSAPPVAPIPAPSKPTYPANSVEVKFGDLSSPLTKRTLEKDKALPSAGHPVLVYMGLTNHGKTALFLVGSDVAQLEGDGSCDTGCTTLRLKAGETEFVDMQPTGSATKPVRYELDLLKIHASVQAKATASAAKAKASRRAPRPRRRPRTHF